MAPTQDIAVDLPADVRQARIGLERLLAKAGWTGDTDMVLLAVQEALTNADRHGAGLRGVCARLHGNELEVEVADHGSVFDIAPYIALAPELLAERGRGLWLIGHLAQAFDVLEEDEGARVTLTFRAEAPVTEESAPPPPLPRLEDLGLRMLEVLQAVAVITDAHLVVRRVVGRVEDVFGLAAEQVVGRDVRGFTAEVKHRFADPALFEDRLLSSYAHPDEDVEELFALVDGRVIRRHSVPLHTAGTFVGRLGMYLPIAEHGELVGALQHELLPPAPDWPELEVGAIYHPADASGFVGGDFYDFIDLSKGGRCVAVGDVSGRGPAAAAASSRVRAYLRAALATAGVTGAVPSVEQALAGDFGSEEFVSMTIAVQEGPDVWSMLNCGHPPALVRRGTDVLVATAAGPLVGLALPGEWSREPFLLQQGDVLLLYTDGVLDAGRGPNRFGSERLAAALVELGDLPMQALVEAIDERIHAYALQHIDDDHVLVAVRRR